MGWAMRCGGEGVLREERLSTSTTQLHNWLALPLSVNLR